MSSAFPCAEQLHFGGINGPEYKRSDSISTLYGKYNSIMAEAELVSFEDGIATLNYMWLDKTAVSNGYELSENEFLVEDIDLTDSVGKTVRVYFDISDEENPTLLTIVEKE